MVAVVHGRVQGEWQLVNLSIIALASNGYKFNGLPVTPGGQRSFRDKQIQLSVDLAAQKAQFDVNVKGDWLHSVCQLVCTEMSIVC